MPSPARLALGPAVALAAVLASGPAWAGTLPCDDYSRACATPSPTAPATPPGGGGGGGGGGVEVPVSQPTPTQGATDGPGESPEPGPTADTGDDDATETTDDGGASTDDGGGITGGGALPVTGGDLVLGLLTGLAAVGAGSALVVAGRRRRSSGLAG